MIHDYLQIYFDDGSILNVYNRIRAPTIDNRFLTKLVDEKISEEATNSETLFLRFSGGSCIKIGMADPDYRGPEALELIEADGRRIVWS